MKTNNSFKRVLLCMALLCCYSGSLWAQEAAVTRNVNLRRDPSTSSPVLAHLASGARLTLVGASADSGFYHVRTENDQVGWVWAKFVKLVQNLTPETAPAAATAAGCDASLWTHVYHPDRLIVQQQCIAVTGTIVDATNGKKSDGVRHEADGDTHGWLKLDSEFESLLNAGNISAEDGNLVFEVVCKFPVKQTDAKAACQGFTDQVNIPAIGSHVRIVGTLVQDAFHAKWMEIHPVTSIAVIP
jgi:Bacterial SH3 domain